MIASQIAYVAFAPKDPTVTATVLQQHLKLPRTDFEAGGAAVPELGFEVESRQTDMEVTMAVESFTSDKYGVVYHNRAPQPVGDLRVAFITVGDCELEFLANFDPNDGAHVEYDRSGSTRQDQGANAMGGILMHLVQRDA